MFQVSDFTVFEYLKAVLEGLYNPILIIGSVLFMVYYLFVHIMAECAKYGEVSVEYKSNRLVLKILFFVLIAHCHMFSVVAFIMCIGFLFSCIVEQVCKSFLEIVYHPEDVPRKGLRYKVLCWIKKREEKHKKDV